VASNKRKHKKPKIVITWPKVREERGEVKVTEKRQTSTFGPSFRDAQEYVRNIWVKWP